MSRTRSTRATSKRQAKTYEHPEAKSPMRPEVGTQARFRKKRQPKTYRYDSSLSPALEWDGQNPAREQGEAELAVAVEQLAGIRAKLAELKGKTAEAGEWPEVEENLARADEAVRKLKALGRPFLNWAGKAERLSFDVPTLPLFVHERLSTKAIMETLKGHRADRQTSLFDLFADPQHSITDQVLGAYEHQDQWVNRMILGDSMVVMNSLLQYEGLGGQVQMIYIDPPYGIKFGSNFQPFVRKRDVTHNDDEDMTREPEMVQAYRDTWELGLHSYLTYLRDRLLLCRDLLHPSGSVFVQISDENLHHVREVMDEVFGAENFVVVITFITANAQTGDLLENNGDYLVWYAKDITRTKYRVPYLPKSELKGGAGAYRYVELPDGSRRAMTLEERRDSDSLPMGSKIFRADKLTSSHPPGDFPVDFEGRVWKPNRGYWSTGPEGMEALKRARRLIGVGDTLSYVRFIDDFPAFPIGSIWTDTMTAGYASEKLYAVQTNPKVIQRCLLMTSDPGDLVLDPTCGSGTTAYVAEQWGRRWITIDTSRVPLALAR